MRNVNQILEGKAGRLVAVPQEAPVLEVIRLMAEHHIGSVLVMQGHELVGIATVQHRSGLSIALPAAWIASMRSRGATK